MVRNNQETFIKKFHKTFSFEEEQERVIEKKLREVEERLFVKLPDRNYRTNKEKNQITIDYEISGGDLLVKIKVECKCSNEFVHYENLDEYEGEGIQILCERCSNLFTTSRNLYWFDYIRNFQLDE